MMADLRQRRRDLWLAQRQDHFEANARLSRRFLIRQIQYMRDIPASLGPFAPRMLLHSQNFIKNSSRQSFVFHILR
jgi:hypothetical protein